jgi:hypothetical protein
MGLSVAGRTAVVLYVVGFGITALAVCAAIATGLTAAAGANIVAAGRVT